MESDFASFGEQREPNISHPVDNSHDIVCSPSAIHLVSPRTKGNLAHLLGQSELFTGGARRQRCCDFGSRPSAALAALEIENTNCKSGYGDHSQRPRVPFIAGDCHVCFVVSYYGGEIVDPQFFRIDPQAPVLALVVRRRDFPTLSEPLLRSFSEAAKPSGLLFYLYDVLPRTGKPHTDTPCSDPRVSKNGQAMANLDQTVYAGYGGGRLEWSSDVRFAIPAG